MTGPKGSKRGEGTKQGFPYSVVVALRPEEKLRDWGGGCEWHRRRGFEGGKQMIEEDRMPGNWRSRLPPSVPAGTRQKGRRPGRGGGVV